MDNAERQRLIGWYRKNRERSRFLFSLVGPESYYSRPIPLRNPIIFYEGHLPAFTVNTLVKSALGMPGVDETLEVLFARGIDPEDEAAATMGGGASLWPSREQVQEYVAAADQLVLQALVEQQLDRDDVPHLVRGQAVYNILEHEPMHHETLMYMWHRLPFEQKHKRDAIEPVIGGDPPRPSTVRVPAGTAILGANPEEIPFGWDNEFREQQVAVPEFEIDVHSVTNHDFLAFVESGGYDDPSLWSAADWEWRLQTGVSHPLFWERHGAEWYWRGMWRLLPLPLAWPVYVSHAEATAFARWKGKRLPTEAEFDRAAWGSPSDDHRKYPWGDDDPDPGKGNFDFRQWDPVPVGSHPAGASAWGIHDLVGNGWEWTSTPFEPFPGFEPMITYPVYSADFFDGKHYVMKGASPVTDATLIRRSFRNWFRGNYPYVYAKFRCAGK